MIETGIVMVPTLDSYMDLYRDATPTREDEAGIKIVLGIVRRFHDLGGIVALGTDFIIDRGKQAGMPQGEMEMLLTAGLTQLCMAHQLRNLQAVVELYPMALWAKAMQALFRYAIHLRNQRDKLSVNHYQIEILRIEWLCDRLLARTLSQPEARKLQNRYRKHREHLFVFLYRRDVPPTNKSANRLSALLWFIVR